MLGSIGTFSGENLDNLVISQQKNLGLALLYVGVFH